MKLPTTLGKQMLTDYFRARMLEPADANLAVAAYQRMALVSDTWEEAWTAVIPYFKPHARTLALDSPERKAVEAVHTMVKKDVLGLAVDCLLGIIGNNAGSSKEKIAASTILNELYGEKELMHDTSLADKLVMNLAK